MVKSSHNFKSRTIKPRHFVIFLIILIIVGVGIGLFGTWLWMRDDTWSRLGAVIAAGGYAFAAFATMFLWRTLRDVRRMSEDPERYAANVIRIQSDWKRRRRVPRVREKGMARLVSSKAGLVFLVVSVILAVLWLAALWTQMYLEFATVSFMLSTVACWSFYDRAQRKRLAGCCTKCGYNLTGKVSGVCPECGEKI